MLQSGSLPEIGWKVDEDSLLGMPRCFLSISHSLPHPSYTSLQFRNWGRDILAEGNIPRAAASFADSVQPGASSLLSPSQLSDLQMMLDIFPGYTDDDLLDAQVGEMDHVMLLSLIWFTWMFEGV